MRLTYTTTQLLATDTVLIDDNQRHLYNIVWSGKLKSTVTIQKLADDDASYTQLALIEYKLLKHETIDWGDGRKVKATEWLPQTSKWSGTRILNARSGTQYEWRTQGTRWTLHRPEPYPFNTTQKPPAREVARSHNYSLGIVGQTAHKPYIEIEEEALEDLDDIIVSFINLKILQETLQVATY